jgi:hypothetical protein
MEWVGLEGVGVGGIWIDEGDGGGDGEDGKVEWS